VQRFGTERAELIAALEQVDGDLAGEAAAQAIPPPGLTSTVTYPSDAGPGPGTRVRYIGDYEILEGPYKGGMGIVYKARQMSLDRIVALKLIKRGELARTDEVERFHITARLAANLEHPGIVRIFEIGKHEGQHYLSMAFVAGESLASRVSRGPLPPDEAARLMHDVCEAVAYAHAQGVIHRDLKPANILLDPQGRPHVTDFGLAKRMASDSGLTVQDQYLGTPGYMSPEQANRQWDQVNEVSDVYSLGATLYELLTGRPPFQAATFVDTLYQVKHEEPVPPRRLNPKLPRDLETICLKCLEKDAAQRYASAQAVADDLGRYSRGEPIAARPISGPARFWRWCRRKPMIAALGGVIAGLVLLAVAGPIVAWREALLRRPAEEPRRDEKMEKKRLDTNVADLKATIARLQAESQKPEAELWNKTYRGAIELAHNAILAKDAPVAEQLLDLCPPELRGWEWRYLKRLCLSPLPSMFYPTEKETVNAVVYAARDRYLISGSSDGVLREWMADSPLSPSSWKHRQEVRAVASAHTRPWVASASGDRTVCLWDLSADHDRALLRTIQVESAVDDLEFSRDDKYLAATGPGRKVRAWQVDAPDQPPVSFDTPGGTANCVAFSPDGRLLAGAVGGVGGSEPVIYAWDFPSGQNPQERKGHTRTIMALAVSHNGRWIASGSADQSVRTAGTQAPTVLTAHTDTVTAVCFAPDCKRFFSAGKDENLIVWDTSNWKPFLTLPGKGQDTTPDTEKEFTSMTITRDGNRVATGSTDRMIKVWNAEYESELLRLQASKAAIKRVVFSPDGTRFATACQDGTVQIWQFGNEWQEIREWSEDHGSSAECCAFSPDGLLLASAARDGSLNLWKADAAEPAKKLLQEKGVLSAVAFYPLPMRSWLAVGGPSRMLRILDATNGHVVHSLSAHEDDVCAVAFSPDGKLLASAGRDKTVLVWDVVAGSRVAAFPGHQGVIRSVAFGPDSTWIASGGDDKRVLVHDVRSGDRLHWDFASSIRSLAVSPKQGWLACGCEDHTIHLWDRRSTFTGSSSRGHARAVHSVSFSSDETQLISGDDCGGVKIWHVEPSSVFTGEPNSSPP
jgi:WD40 repeat protein/tRNA A-37 threonylcarbamoyl transferase component Bud32